MNTIILIIVAIVGIALGAYFTSRKSVSRVFEPRSDDELDEMREGSREALAERTERRKERILNLMNSEAVHEEELKACNVADIKKGITCANVEKLLDVSSGTARKYLNELESENKIKQVGKSGRDVYYVLK